jgi:hypothetical protein
MSPAASATAGLHDLARIRLRLVERILLHDARTHRRHAGRKRGQMIVAIRWPPNAGRVIFRFLSLHCPTSCWFTSSVEALRQEVHVLGHIDVQVRAVGAQAGVQARRAARAQVTADVGRADQQDLGLQALDAPGRR